ncbi:MAG: hypothetical protein ACPG47_05685 [Leucothrix sp.]
MKIIHTDHPVSDQERAQIIFAGDLLIHKNIDAMHELINWTDELLKRTLKGLEPTTAQAQLDPTTFISHTSMAQTSFRQSQDCRTLFFKALQTCGVDTSNTHYDHFPLRVVPYGDRHGGARNAYISHHRDTWGSNIHSQINWWAPIYELEATRTIAIYPKYWQEPLANNTAEWCFEKHLESRRNTPVGLKAPYPSAPSPQAEIDEADVVRVMLQPGDILSFSSAHLHASVPNTSSHTRYSVEMRTINQTDLATGSAAPNVDNAGTESMYQWFKPMKQSR